MKILLAFLAALTCAHATQVVDGRLKIRFRSEVSASEMQTFLNQNGLEILYQLLPYDASLTKQFANRSVIPLNYTEAIRIEGQLLRTYVVSYTNAMSAEDFALKLSTSCSAIEIAEPVHVMELCGKPNDPRVEEQNMMQTMQVFEAWDVEQGDSTVVIGIGDSGINQDHEDLVSSIFINKAEVPLNLIDDDGNGYVDDYRGYNFCFADDSTPPGITYNKREGHGSGVSGICAATVNNGIGIAGMANKCKFFPMKTMPDNAGGIIYGYESLIYCAANGFKVANCSWGSQSKSCIDSTTIAYVIARGVAVVAAAGNHGSSAKFYPASYPGVLSVGVTDPADGVVPMSAYGPNVDIMAPGQGTLTTANEGGYTTFCCTSGASPIVAGVVGLVRSHYPQLSPAEVCALVREAVDDSPWTSIPGNTIAELLPKGRLNVLKALTFPPDSIPSLEFGDVVCTVNKADQRWTVGDTIHATISAVNVLGDWQVDSITNVALISTGVNTGIQLLTSERAMNVLLKKGDVLTIHDVQCVATIDTDTTTFISADVIGKTSYGDRVVRKMCFPITPVPTFRDAGNDVLSVSIGDRARIGNTDLNRAQGNGFKYKDWCGQLYEGGLIVTANGKVVDAVRAAKGNHDYFKPIKKFVSPDSMHAIVSDADAPDSVRLNIEVDQKVHVASLDSGVIVYDFVITNKSASPLYDLAAGWFLDWDLGTQPAHNAVWLEPNASFVVEGARSTDPLQPIAMCGVRSAYSDASGIAVGLDNTTTYDGFPDSMKVRLMYSGTTEQSTEVTDISIISGVRFHDPIASGQQRAFRHVIAIGTNQDSVHFLLNKYLVLNRPSNVPSIGKVFPLPSSDFAQVALNVNAQSNVALKIVDVQGRVVSSTQIDPQFFGLQQLDLRELASGTYEVMLNTDGVVFSTPLVVLR